MPFVSIGFVNVLRQWFPGEIDAYHAVKIKNIVLHFYNNLATAILHEMAIGFDESPIIPITSDFKSTQIAMAIRLGINYTSIVIPINDLNKIIGDYMSFHTASIDLRCNAIIFYDVISTSFDQYGQVSKTLKRYFTK